MKKFIKTLPVLVVISLMVISFGSCAVLMLKPGLVNSDDFGKNASQMDVRGRYGWGFNKVVRYGPYYTSKFNMGIVKGEIDEPTGLNYHSEKTESVHSKQKFSFKQFDSSGDSIKVNCFAERTTLITQYSKELSGDEIIRDKFEIKLSQNDREFVLLYTPGNNEVPSITFENDTFCIINAFKRDLNSNKIFSGFFIICKNDTLAAVEMSKLGIVWIRNDLDAKVKIRLAAISTAILLKPEI